MNKVRVKDLSGFHEWINKEIIPLVQPHTLFLLVGEVGAGKTELIKTVSAHFGMKDVQSPTFAFHHAYDNGKLKLHHLDLYRLSSEEDLESIGFWDLFENRTDAILIEWSNMLQDDVWPWGWKKISIHIEKISENERQISWQEA